MDLDTAWIPPLASGAVTIGVILVNRWWTTRDRAGEESSTVTKARIDDGTKMRSELVEDLRLARQETAHERDKADALRTETIEMRFKVKALEDEAADLRAQIRGLLAQIDARKGN